jgi:hypothetical protein
MYVKDKMFISEIARHFDVADSTIKNILRNQNINLRPKGKRGNKYIIEDNIAKIELRRWNKESLWAIIDLDDLDKVINYPYTWHSVYKEKTKSYYVAATVGYDEVDNVDENRNHYPLYLHQLIMNIDTKFHKNVDIDHENHDTLDNRKENLRISYRVENSKNRNGRNTNNKTGYRNVAYVPSNGNKPYIVQLIVDGKNKRIKSFSDVDEAGTYAEKMRNELYGEFAGETERVV